jgi:hypothetical protein
VDIESDASVKKVSDESKRVRLRINVGASMVGRVDMQKQCSKTAHRLCEDLPLPLAHAGDKKVKRFHFSEIIGRLPYVRATVTDYPPSPCCIVSEPGRIVLKHNGRE